MGLTSSARSILWHEFRSNVRFGSWLCKNPTARDSDRINDAPSRRVIQNDSQARPISVDLRKIILVAF
jgi:hypothetical protein